MVPWRRLVGLSMPSGLLVFVGASALLARGARCAIRASPPGSPLCAWQRFRLGGCPRWPAGGLGGLLFVGSVLPGSSVVWGAGALPAGGSWCVAARTLRRLAFPPAAPPGAAVRAPP